MAEWSKALCSGLLRQYLNNKIAVSLRRGFESHSCHIFLSFVRTCQVLCSLSQKFDQYGRARWPSGPRRCVQACFGNT